MALHYVCDVCGDEMQKPFSHEVFEFIREGKKVKLTITYIRTAQLQHIDRKCVREIILNG